MAYSNIKDPSEYFQTLLYTGNSSSPRDLVNDGNSDLQPDWVWIKGRSHADLHLLYDSSRGAGKFIRSESTAAENTGGYGLTAFNSDGFRTNAYAYSNENTHTYVAWQWKCNGGTTASNTDGDINSTVQVNQDAGFSIVTYTGNGSTSDQTIGHGLGVRANAVIVKNRDSAANWVVWSEGVDANHSLELNTTDSISDSTQGRVLSNAGSRGTSTIFSIRNGSGSVVQTNTNNEDYVAYCFAEKQGYSRFGKYIGNGSGTSDGTFDGRFVYTGFKPAWVMVKRSSYSAGDGWEIWDSTRPPRGGSTTDGNYINNKLNAASAGAESGNVYDAVDFLSNGFKLRTGRAGTNAAGSTYIYMAFAESPFVADGIPTTAR